MTYPPYEEFKVENFKGGMVSGKNPPAGIEAEESVLIQDFLLTEEGDLEVAPGRTALTEVFDSNNPTTGVGVLNMFDDDDRLVCASGEKAYFKTFNDVFVYDTQAQWQTGTPIRIDWVSYPGKLSVSNVAALFNRNSLAFDEKYVLYSAHQPKFKQGKYGLNIAIEEGTQNLVRDASFESSTAINHTNSPWKFAGLQQTGDSAVKSTAEKIEGNYSAYIIARSGAEIWGIYQNVVPPTGGWIAGDEYFLTAKVKVKDTGQGGVKSSVYAMNVGYQLLSESRTLITEASDDFVDIKLPLTIPTGTSMVYVEFVAYNEGGSSPNASFYVETVQLEKKPYPTTFIRAVDDTTQAIRDAEYFYFSAESVMNNAEGTIDLQISPLTEITRKSITNGEYIDFVYGDTSSNGFYIYHTTLNNAGIIGVKYFSSAGIIEFKKHLNWEIGKSINITFTWSSEGCFFIVEGKQEGYNINTFIYPPGGVGYIGGYINRLSGNSLYEGIRVSDIARQKDIIIDNHTKDEFLFDGNVVVRWGYEPIVGNHLDGKAGYGIWESPWIDLLAVTDKTKGYIRQVKDDTSTLTDISTTFSPTLSITNPWVLVGSNGRIRNFFTERYIKIRVKISRVENSIPLLDKIAGYWAGHLPITLELTGLTKNAPMSFTPYMNKLVLSNGIDSMYNWDGSSEMPRKLKGRPPSGRFLQVFANYLFFANSIDKPARLYWSGLLDVDGYTSRNFIDIPPEDDSITGLIKFGNNLVITKNKSIYVLTGSGYEDFKIEKLHSIGSVAPESLVIVENMISFVNEDGIYFSDFTGEPVNMIAAKSMQAEWEQVNKQYLYKSASVYYDNKLFVCVPYKTSTYNNFTFIFDLKHKAWTISKQTAASCFNRYDDGTKRLVVFGLPDKGQIAYWHYGKSDLTANISSILETKRWDLTLPKNYKLFRQIYLNLNNAIGSSGNTPITVKIIADDVEIPNSFTITVPNKTMESSYIARIIPIKKVVNIPSCLITSKTIGLRIEENTNNGGVGVNGMIIRYSIKHRTVVNGRY